MRMANHMKDSIINYYQQYHSFSVEYEKKTMTQSFWKHFWNSQEFNKVTIEMLVFQSY